MGALSVDLVAAWIGTAMDALVSLWFGVVVNGVNKLIGVIGSEVVWSEELGVGCWLFLHRRRRVGVWRTDGVMVERSGDCVEVSRRLVSVCIHAEIDA